MKLPPEKLIYLNDLATRSFRDVADQDYIAARLCYRSGLMLQFVWLAQQALEKYLKAILLYNGETTLDLGHELMKALCRVEAIKRIEFAIEPDVRDFIRYVDRQGVNRYLEKVHYTRGLELLELDKCVWGLRLYCRALDYDFKRTHSGKLDPKLASRRIMDIELAEIRRWKCSRSPHKFRLFAGLLERVLSKQDDVRREPLIWQNFYYGERRHSRVRLASNSGSVNPTQVLHPEQFDLFAQYVKFPKSVIEQFAAAQREGSGRRIKP